MITRLIKTAFVTCLLVGTGGIGAVFAEGIHPGGAHGPNTPGYPPAFFGLPTTPLSAPPGMVPMIIYVPAQQMQAPIPPHTHAPQAATIEGTHCLINDVAVLTQDAPSCEKAGGKVVAERALFENPSSGCDLMTHKGCL